VNHPLFEFEVHMALGLPDPVFPLQEASYYIQDLEDGARIEEIYNDVENLTEIYCVDPYTYSECCMHHHVSALRYRVVLNQHCPSDLRDIIIEKYYSGWHSDINKANLTGARVSVGYPVPH